MKPVVGRGGGWAATNGDRAQCRVSCEMVVAREGLGAACWVGRLLGGEALVGLGRAQEALLLSRAWRSQGVKSPHYAWSPLGKSLLSSQSSCKRQKWLGG